MSFYYEKVGDIDTIACGIFFYANVVWENVRTNCL